MKLDAHILSDLCICVGTCFNVCIITGETPVVLWVSDSSSFSLVITLKFKLNLNQTDWRVSNMIGSAAPTCVNLKAAKAGALSSRNMKPMMLSSCVL